MGIGQNILISGPIALFIAIISWPSGENESPESTAQKSVALFKGVLPKTLPDGTHLSAPLAEGSILVFTMTPSNDLAEAYTDAEIEQLNFNAACANRIESNLFSKGVKLRVDIKSGTGSVRKGQVRESCSAA